jgi:hypothetical protein
MISKVKVTPQTIVNLNDEQLDDMVYNKAADLYLGTFGETFRDDADHELLRQIFAVSVLDLEIRNGGFYSFFDNSGDLFESAVSGLNVLNAKEHVDLLTRASSIDRTQEKEINEDGDTELDSLSDVYYSLEHIADKRMKFVRDKIHRFLD